jgi:hypothetical protein
MKIARRIAVVALALALSACATKWVKPGSSEQDLLTDQSECEADAEAAFATQGRLQNIAASVDKRGFFERCMIAHGWRDKDGKIASARAPFASRTQPLYLPGYSR